VIENPSLTGKELIDEIEFPRKEHCPKFGARSLTTLVRNFDQHDWTPLMFNKENWVRACVTIIERIINKHEFSSWDKQRLP